MAEVEQDDNDEEQKEYQSSGTKRPLSPASPLLDGIFYFSFEFPPTPHLVREKSHEIFFGNCKNL
jgi:hypothetical protein